MGRSENTSELTEAFAAAVRFALASPDFEAVEGERYLALAFERDRGVEYGLIADRLNQMGSFDDARAGEAAIHAFFSQRPWVLASLARDWPEVVGARREDGLDICKHGLAMAVATGQAEAALWLAGAMGRQPETWKRLSSAFATAREISSSQVQSVISWVYGDENVKRENLVIQIIAECERSAMDSELPCAPRTKKGTKSL